LYLEWLFQASCAISLPSNFPMFHIVASIRCRYLMKKKDSFIPFAICVKSHWDYDTHDSKDKLETMKAEMTRNKIQYQLYVY
jgi:hypothetical protein